MRQFAATSWLARFTAVAMIFAIGAQLAAAQTSTATNPLRQEGADEKQLVAKQSRLASRYDQLELLAGRLAELSRATQPRRAKLLRELVAKSREQDITGRFAGIIAALESERLGKATSAQGKLHADLQKLLELLLQEDRDKQIESERKRIRKYLAELKHLIQLQRGIKARTDGGDDTDRLTDDQGKLSAATGKLEQEIKANESPSPGDQAKDQSTPADSKQSDSQGSQGDPNEDNKPSEKAKQSDQKQESSQEQPTENAKPGEPNSSGESNPGEQNSGEPSKADGKPNDGKPSKGKPSDSQPSDGQNPSQSQPGDDGESEPSEQSQSPAERAQQRLKKAQQRMQRALEQLEKIERDKAVDQQEQALRELEQAKAELERILRQLREEELERTLVLLEARFRKMLDAQVVVYEQTKKIDANQSSVPEHEIEISSGRLARQERAIVREADRALVLLREDGTTVAFPEAIQQARDDMQSVEKRLSEVKTGVITQGLEEDIIAALEETLAALQQAIKEARARKGQPQQSSGSPEDQSLVDQLAELRMIRALQGRINRRTERYGQLIGDQPTADPDLREALDELAVRQERVFQATRDLDSGRNK